MKKLLLVTSVLTFSLSFSQSKDLTKKQALEAYKKSDVRKQNNLKISDFEKIYKTATCIKKTYSDKENLSNDFNLRSMPIFNNKEKEKVNNCAPKAEFCIYGVEMWILAGSTDEESKKLKTEENCFF